MIGLVERLVLVVHGDPAPQGSKKGFQHPTTGRVIVKEQLDGRIKSWRQDVVTAGLTAGAPMYDEPLFVEMVFTAVRPKSHYRTGRNAHLLRDNAPARPVSPPDVSKLARSTEDALTTAGVWRDDARVAEYLRLAKVWAGEDRDALNVPGAVIRIYTLTDRTAQ